MKFKIFKFKEVTSTNDVAINLIKNKKKKYGCIYADTQIKGRGSYGRKWISNKGNLFGTIFFQLKDNYPPFNEFSIVNPIIISEVIENYCDKKKIKFKFPNDVFINGKKVCGLLQELITLNNKKFLIVGVGLNIISNPDIYEKEYKATNLFLETKKKPKIREIINLIIRSYEKFFNDLNIYNFENFKKKAESMAR